MSCVCLIHCSHNEERNLLRIREWERRNQEALQEKEFYQENVPLFGEPYKASLVPVYL
jgi:hypothetical protein